MAGTRRSIHSEAVNEATIAAMNTAVPTKMPHFALAKKKSSSGPSSIPKRTNGFTGGRVAAVDVFRFDLVAFREARSGSSREPVSRFHSSYVLGEIFPSTRSCANFRRCAWLLKGIVVLAIQKRCRERGRRKRLTFILLAF